jgi:subtilisin family serine protease
MKRGSRRLVDAAVSVTLAGVLAVGTLTGPATGVTADDPDRDYLVFYAEGRQAQAIEAITDAGGTAVSTDARIGLVVVRGSGTAFVERVGRSDAIVGVSSNRKIGYASAAPHRSTPRSDERAVQSAAVTDTAAASAAEPLAGRQWDMKMIGATVDGSYKKAQGSKKVLVGVIDTGIDGKHPDIAPNFNRELSRNFVVDIPKDPKGQEVDGPCEHKGCKDPADVDDDGHGTHVASTIASPINGLGVAGVAPGVQLVNIRAGQDSGYFFLKPSLDALTYAADAGIDVVNMSYYIDPWLFNCTANPADSKAQQLEQRAVITGMQRALDYARNRGVTLITAIGNGSTDLGKPRVDTTSPNYPAGGERSRKVDNTCLNVPAESKGVISVTAVGPSGRKAYYSDYGIEQADLSAPGGDQFDTGNARTSDVTRGVLAAAPEHALRREGLIDKSGRPTTTAVVRDCKGRVCGYYQYLQGSSMAAPHATGVAAILISRFGKPGKGGLTLKPAEVERLLYATATKRACPSPRTQVYELDGQKEKQVCEGGKSRNGFYGRGIVNAERAATVER